MERWASRPAGRLIAEWAPRTAFERPSVVTDALACDIDLHRRDGKPPSPLRAARVPRHARPHRAGPGSDSRATSSAGYITARELLDWRAPKSLLAGVVLSASSFILFSSFQGWQAQIALTSLALASVVFFRIALERQRSTRESVLAGVLAAGALGTYGLLFGPFVPLYLFVLGAFAYRERGRVSRSRLWRVVGVTGSVAVALGAVAIVRAFGRLGDLAETVGTAPWSGFRTGSLPDAIGLLEAVGYLGPLSSRATFLATVVFLAITAMLLGLLLRGSVDRLGAAYDFLLGGSLYFACAIGALAVLPVSPYTSMKLQGYGAPILTLTAFTVLAAPGLKRVRRAPVAVHPRGYWDGVRACERGNGQGSGKRPS